MITRRELRPYAKAMRREPTDAERILWRWLRNGQIDGLKFRRQVPLGRYIADFACYQPKLIVEADGGQHADNPDDAERDAWFEAEGYTVLRFWNTDVLHEIEGVLATIRASAGVSE